MPKLKDRFYIFKSLHLQAIGAICILLFALVLLWRGNATSNQAMPALVAQVYFDGEYRIAVGSGRRSSKETTFLLLREM